MGVFNPQRRAYLCVERSEHDRDCGNKGGLVAVASSNVLRSNDADRIAFLRLHQKDFGGIVGKIGSCNYLGYEHPEFEGIVGGFMVQNKIEPRNLLLFCKVQAPEEFFGNGEQSPSRRMRWNIDAQGTWLRRR